MSDRFSFAIDEECIEFYDESSEGRIMCITTIEETIQLQHIIQDAMFEWEKINKIPTDHKLNPEKEKQK